MAWTLGNLRALIGRKLAVIGAGETLSAEDASAIDSALQRGFDDLDARDVIPGNQTAFTTATIPDALGEGFALLAAGLVGPEFGKPLDWCEGMKRAGEIAIRRICSVKYVADVDPDAPVPGDDDYSSVVDAVYY